MAGDWIKMRGTLMTHPKVLRMAALIGLGKAGRLSPGFNGQLCAIVSRDVTRDITLASLLRVWCATNEHTTDGKWCGVTLEDIDTIAGVDGFAAAMVEVGWLSVDGDVLTLPNFLEWNAPAKGGRQTPAARRQAAYRARLAAQSGDVTPAVTGDITVTPREEKKREEKEEKGARKRTPSFDASQIELPEWLDRELWQAWVADRKERGKPITKRAAEQQLLTLDDFRKNGTTPERVLRHAIASGNQGLFAPPKVSTNPADVARITVPGPKPSNFLAEQAAHRAAVEAERIARIERQRQAA